MTVTAAPDRKRRGPADRTAGGKGRKTLLSQIAVVLAFTFLWHVFSLSETGTAASMPGPLQTAGRWAELMLTADYWSALGSTVLSWAAAMAICLVGGISLGMLIGVSTKATESTRFVIDFLRTIPAVALIPLALLVFGPERSMVVFVAVSAAIWPVIISPSTRHSSGIRCCAKWPGHFG